MSREETKDLLKFLKAFSEEIQENALWLREFVWDLYPKCNELIYDNPKEAYANSKAKMKLSGKKQILR